MDNQLDDLTRKPGPSLVVLADGAVGSECVDWLLTNYPDDLALVVTVGENATHHRVRSLGIGTHVFSSTQELLLETSASGVSFDLGLLIWWPFIITKDTLNIPKHGFVNTHPSLLPFNRGRNPNFWALVDQNPFGVSLHRVEQGIDSGALLAQKTVPHSWEDTGGTLYGRALIEMVNLFTESYPILRKLHFDSKPQPFFDRPVRKSGEMEKKSLIDLDEPTTARELFNLIRARTFEPYPSCTFEEDGVQYGITVHIERKK